MNATETKYIILLLVGLLVMVFAYNPYKHTEVYKICKSLDGKYIYTNKLKRLTKLRYKDPKFILLSDNPGTFGKLTLAELSSGKAVVAYFYGKPFMPRREWQKLNNLAVRLRDFHFYVTSGGFLVSNDAGFVNPSHTLLSEFLYDSLKTAAGLKVYTNNPGLVKSLIDSSYPLPAGSSRTGLLSLKTQIKDGSAVIAYFYGYPAGEKARFPNKRQIIRFARRNGFAVKRFAGGILVCPQGFDRVRKTVE